MIDSDPIRRRINKSLHGNLTATMENNQEVLEALFD